MVKKKQTLKKNIKNTSSKRDKYTIVLEDMRSQFQIFGETLGHVSNRMDEQAKHIEEIKTDMELVKSELALIRHNQVTRDEFKFLEARVARLERAK